MVRSAHDAVIEQSLGASSPFGQLRVDSNRTPDQVVAPATAAAGNLVAKAVRARMQGDGDRASALLERAARLPYDEHEGWWPVLHAGSMALFDSIVDDLEASEEGDERWLDRALAVHARAAGVGRQEVAQLLATVGQNHQLTRDEHRRLRPVRREIDESAESVAFRCGPDTSLDDRRRITAAVLDVVVDHAHILSAADQG